MKNKSENNESIHCLMRTFFSSFFFFIICTLLCCQYGCVVLSISCAMAAGRQGLSD